MTSVSKRSWKLQEFTAHGANVNCLALGHKSGRVLVTGGDDKKVNLWAIGKENCIMSLSGHATPVECVKFGHTEDLVCAGSQSGILKVWDLEAAKLVRTLAGHKAAIKCVDFHPYGDFLASGSLDTSIKMWDIRRKGCIFTYKGHEQTVNSIQFSPDGQWIASGDEEGQIKIWDLRIGRILKEMNKHVGAVTDIEFHPHEFLLASSSADRSVYLWDLETFQPISKTEKESSLIRCLYFSLNGECLFGGCAEQLKVYGWEPTCVYDTVSIGWGKVQDMAISQNQLIGASFYLSNVLVCVVDLSKVSPFAPPSQGLPKSQSNFTRDTVVRKSFNKQNNHRSDSKVKIDVKPIEEYETEPEDESALFIPNVTDYTTVFSPQRTLNRSPPPPLQRPINEQPKAAATSASQHSYIQNSLNHSAASTSTRNILQVKQQTVSASNRSSPPVNLNPVSLSLNHGQSPSSPSPPPLSQSPPLNQGSPASRSPPYTTAFSSLNSDEHVDNNNSVPYEVDENVLHNNNNCEVIPISSSVPNGLSVDEFLPADYRNASHRRQTSNYTETETLTLITRGHQSMVAILKNRKTRLEVIYSVWRKKDFKSAMEEVVSMNDESVIVDVLSVINGKPALWNLDICAILLPPISDLLQSKYETYMSVGCDSLRLILRNFASVIKANTLWSVPPIGVDISKEERYNKCMKCYNILVSVRTFLLKRQTVQGKLGQSFRELLTMLQEIDNHKYS